MEDEERDEGDLLRLTEAINGEDSEFSSPDLASILTWVRDGRALESCPSESDDAQAGGVDPWPRVLLLGGGLEGADVMLGEVMVEIFLERVFGMDEE